MKYLKMCKDTGVHFACTKKAEESSTFNCCGLQYMHPVIAVSNIPGPCNISGVTTSSIDTSDSLERGSTDSSEINRVKSLLTADLTLQNRYSEEIDGPIIHIYVCCDHLSLLHEFNSCYLTGNTDKYHHAVVYTTSIAEVNNMACEIEAKSISFNTTLRESELNWKLKGIKNLPLSLK